MIPKTGTDKFESVVSTELCNMHFAVEYSKQFETTTEKIKQVENGPAVCKKRNYVCKNMSLSH